MLRALHRFLGTEIPVVGVNFGRVGFLASVPPNELESGLARVFSGDYRVVNLTTLEVEVAGMLNTAPHPDLAKKFLQFLVSKDFQQAIPETNWMYPVIDGATPADFDKSAPQPQKVLLLPSDEVAANRTAWIKEWLDAVGQ